MAAERRTLPGGPLHFSHGPIELIIAAEGEPRAVAAAHEAAWVRFEPLLAELVAELPLLRRPVSAGPNPLRGPVGRRMWEACAALPTQFITPMAAVAGAVAQEIVAAYVRPGITRAWVNNGGDIALHLTSGAWVRCGIVGDIAAPALDGALVIGHADPVRGIATSGWRGRSQSLGIADAVTVLAATAAEADAAATLIANAVNVDDVRIGRRPAREVKDDSDLGERLVTVAVPPLPSPLVQRALRAGRERALSLRSLGLIHDAALMLQGQALMLESPAHPLQSQLAAA
jgi:ApbE superfamily uncharacterized protein (UPF0280 family)